MMPPLTLTASGTSSPDANDFVADNAQMLVCTATVTDVETAVRVAKAALSHDDLVGLMPFLQPAALDAETERLVDQQIRKRGCTCVVVAHRLSTIQDADRIHVMHHGAVAEAGTHAELLSAAGLYAKLWRLQALAGPIS